MVRASTKVALDRRLDGLKRRGPDRAQISFEGVDPRPVAARRVGEGQGCGAGVFVQLAGELAEVSPQFRQLWGEQEVFAEPEGAKVVSHPDVGEIALDHVALLHVEPDGRTLRVTLYTPRPGESTERLARIVAAGVALDD